MKLKNKHKIMKRLLSSRNDSNCVYKPDHFLSSFTNISSIEVLDWLNVMKEERLIELTLADSPECDDIVSIQILPMGLNYFISLTERKSIIRRNWIQFWIPVTISIIALLKSFSREILWLILELMK